MEAHPDPAVRAATMELELTAALSQVRRHSYVQSVEISPGPEAIVHLRATELPSDVSAALIRECAHRGLHIEINSGNQLVVAPELALSRTAVLALGQALSDSLTAIGSICGAPVKASRASEKSLSPHERDLLANVPPHHGE
jgi:hypothetical protein